ncbi:hypothetical protein GOP47_0011764 [Adiantum capillus-veneris]|uniref:Uncharacterized protein n=1 Tax=Adiantum capillus-veneris TaxID=13818 RepID=A0A9D4ZI49_ADICA|nr:hypothetical protein GOP47_0011764 [Adiantum capillus-veneris]
MVAIVASSSSMSSLHSVAYACPLHQHLFPLKSRPSLSFTPSSGFCLIFMVTKKVSALSSGNMSWLFGIRGGGNLVNLEWLDGFFSMTMALIPSTLERIQLPMKVEIFVGQVWNVVPEFQVGAQPRAIAPFSFGKLLGTQLLLMRWFESTIWVDLFDTGTQSLLWF